jgi:hypothetical protein
LSNEIEKIALLEQPLYAGLMIGQLKKQFALSIEGADLVSKISNNFHMSLSMKQRKNLFFMEKMFTVGQLYRLRR